MRYAIPLTLAMLATPVWAGENLQLDAHEHGVGHLDIAIDGNTVLMELHAPGADIVGFEHAAKSAQDRAAVDAAVAMLARPLDLFALPAKAECTVTQASAGLESGHDHEDHDDHAHDEDHAAHDDHSDSDAGHTEFHAAYELTCANPGAIGEITFAYFTTFENAREVEVQIVTNAGAKAFEVERDAPTLDLRGMF